MSDCLPVWLGHECIMPLGGHMPTPVTAYPNKGSPIDLSAVAYHSTQEDAKEDEMLSSRCFSRLANTKGQPTTAVVLFDKWQDTPNTFDPRDGSTQNFCGMQLSSRLLLQQQAEPTPYYQYITLVFKPGACPCIEASMGP